MPPPVPTTIASGFASALGSAYRLTADLVYVAESGSGHISAVNPHTHVKTTVGTGYNAPSDVELSVDGLHAYVTENPGTLLRVALTNMNRAAATVVATGLNGVDQIALDEAHGFAYVCEFTGGHIQRVNLTTGVKTVAVTIASPRGVLVTDDGRFLYVSNDGGAITRFDLSTNTHVTIAGGLNAPRHLTWADAGESTILFAQRNPTPTVRRADLTTTPATVTTLAAPTAADPYSVTVLSSNQLLIACASVVQEVDLTASVYTVGGPILLGIGFVPADTTHLPGGYADTTMDPSYFFQVKDCPFGGTLPLMINWEHARSIGASFYQVWIEGPVGPPQQIIQPFGDYLWHGPPLNEFVLQTTTATPVAPAPPGGGFYQLRSPGQIWLNNWLGLLLDTTGRPNGPNTISVKLFSAASTAAEIPPAPGDGHSATVMIDNTVPVANIEQIFQEPAHTAIPVCAIVKGPPTFSFEVTASAPLAHLLGWSLTAYWGDNQSKAVASDHYSNHVTPTKQWAGITNTVVPPPGPAPWDATTPDPHSTQCAHTFFLDAWDRVINGWGYVHGTAEYHKSITIWV